MEVLCYKIQQQLCAMPMTPNLIIAGFEELILIIRILMQNLLFFISKASRKNIRELYEQIKQNICLFGFVYLIV
jgi:hypothetical protein